MKQLFFFIVIYIIIIISSACSDDKRPEKNNVVDYQDLIKTPEQLQEEDEKIESKYSDAEIKETFEKINILYNQNSYDDLKKALKLCIRIRNSEPDNYKIYNRIGEIYIALGFYYKQINEDKKGTFYFELALINIKKAIDLAGIKKYTYRTLAKLFLNYGKENIARKYVKMALREDKKDNETIFLAWKILHGGNIKSKYLKILRKARLDKAFILSGIANGYYNAGSYSQAIKYFKWARDRAKNDAITFYNLGNSMFKNQDYLFALTAYRESLKINDKLPFTHFNIALTYIKLGLRRFDKQISEHLKKVISYSKNKKDVEFAEVLLKKLENN